MSSNSFIENFKIENISPEDITNVENYFNTIIQISSILDSSKVKYAIVGSAGLILHYQKMNRIPKDIDLLIQREDNESYIASFDQNNIPQDKIPWTDRLRRSHWLLNDIKIDVWTTYSEGMKRHPNKLYQGAGFLDDLVLEKEIGSIAFKYQDPKVVLNLKTLNKSEKALADIQYFTSN